MRSLRRACACAIPHLNDLTFLCFLIILILLEKLMKKTRTSQSCTPARSCCSVESVVSVDERGQMVLPKEIREKANIKAGDKLAVVGWQKEGHVCCISLIKADQLGDMVRSLLGPMLAELSPSGTQQRSNA